MADAEAQEKGGLVTPELEEDEPPAVHDEHGHASPPLVSLRLYLRLSLLRLLWLRYGCGGCGCS
jgi:hypothetical protein